MKGKELLRESAVNYYPGKPTFGYAKAMGDLVIYDDHLEYEKTLGNALGSAFGLVGMLVARSKARKEGAVDIYLTSDIRSVEETRYCGLSSMIVLHMKDGSKHSFVRPLSLSRCAAAIRASL